MINGKGVLAVIPARGGSKGIPHKNIVDLAGKPLIAWTIETAQKSQYIDRLILSSEDERIMQVARLWGCEVPFKRPDGLAQDNTPGIEPVLHAIRNVPGYDYVVLLQPTSPLRSTEDIDSCIRNCAEKKAKACVSVTEPDQSPYWMYRINSQGCLQPVMADEPSIYRRQDLPAVYALNGAVYVADSQWLLKEKSFLTEQTVTYKMPRQRSADIDDSMDLLFIRFLLQQQ
jgi:CMP-N,N'-diacetyllegionaminic acid synthase